MAIAAKTKLVAKLFSNQESKFEVTHKCAQMQSETGPSKNLVLEDRVRNIVHS